MMRKQKGMVLIAVMAGVLFFAASEGFSAVIYGIYTDKSSFLSAAAGEGIPLLTQDFTGYSPSTNMIGVEFLPGVTVSTNMSELKIWTDHSLAAFDYPVRQSGTAYYQINLSQPVYALGFDVVNWEKDPPTPAGAVDKGVFDVYISGAFFGSYDYLQIDYSGNIPPFFFGVISSLPITKIVWNEPHEGESYGGGNEETSLDNFYIGPFASVPEPSLALLLGFAGAALVGLRKKTK